MSLIRVSSESRPSFRYFQILSEAFPDRPADRSCNEEQPLLRDVLPGKSAGLLLLGYLRYVNHIKLFTSSDFRSLTRVWLRNVARLLRPNTRRPLEDFGHKSGNRSSSSMVSINAHTRVWPAHISISLPANFEEFQESAFLSSFSACLSLAEESLHFLSNQKTGTFYVLFGAPFVVSMDAQRSTTISMMFYILWSDRNLAA